jgi:hypothetical protein
MPPEAVPPAVSAEASVATKRRGTSMEVTLPFRTTNLPGIHFMILPSSYPFSPISSKGNPPLCTLYRASSVPIITVLSVKI